MNHFIPARAFRRAQRRAASSIFILACALLSIAACADQSLPTELSTPFAASVEASPGAVFTQTNASAGNAVVAFRRAPDGTLTETGSFPTDGLGLGAGLGSQGAVTLSSDGRFLFVTNAGSNNVSVFAVASDQLTLTDVEDSNGTRPVSIAVLHNRVYVLNAGSDNIAGFTIDNAGVLTALPNSSRLLASSGAGAAQIAFSHDGAVLVVTERLANRIESFAVRKDGTLGEAQSLASAAPVPFGFGFFKNGAIVVSEAAGGAVSSYAVSPQSLSLITGPVATTQAAPCWVVVAPNHRFAYSANAGSASISTISIAQDGSLTLLLGAAGTLTAGPLDMAFSRNGRFLYAVSPNAGTVTAFAVKSDGSLVNLGAAGTLPRSVYGLAAL
jgi:6-phosphogluconolactonase (cycloisomerase 2 family)